MTSLTFMVHTTTNICQTWSWALFYKLCYIYSPLNLQTNSCANFCTTDKELELNTGISKNKTQLRVKQPFSTETVMNFNNRYITYLTKQTNKQKKKFILHHSNIWHIRQHSLMNIIVHDTTITEWEK